MMTKRAAAGERPRRGTGRGGATRSITDRIKDVLGMTAVGLLISVAYVTWVGLLVLSTGDLA